jgi:hypothetical protein
VASSYTETHSLASRRVYVTTVWHFCVTAVCHSVCHSRRQKASTYDLGADVDSAQTLLTMLFTISWALSATVAFSFGAPCELPQPCDNNCNSKDHLRRRTLRRRHHLDGFNDVPSHNRERRLQRGGKESPFGGFSHPLIANLRRGILGIPRCQTIRASTRGEVPTGNPRPRLDFGRFWPRWRLLGSRLLGSRLLGSRLLGSRRLPRSRRPLRSRRRLLLRRRRRLLRLLRNTKRRRRLCWPSASSHHQHGA